MPLSTTNFHTRGPVKSLDMMQFVNLFTGVMNDQPVTFRNSVSIGGDQSNITVPLKIYGAPTQTTNLIDLYPDRTSPQPGFGFSAKGAFAWGPGGTAPQDTFLSRIASQNGHAGDTAGLLLNPRLEITAGLQVGSGLTVLGGGMNVVGGATISGNLGLTGSATISGALSVGTTSSFTGHMDINMQPPALSNGAYADGHLQLMAGGALNPRIGFHQVGSTALALYKETAQERLRIKGAGGNDWGIWTNETRSDMDLNARYLSTGDGSNGIVSARNGSLYIRSSGANYNAIFDTGSAGVIISSGPLSVQAFNAAGAATLSSTLTVASSAQFNGSFNVAAGGGNARIAGLNVVTSQANSVDWKFDAGTFFWGGLVPGANAVAHNYNAAFAVAPCVVATMNGISGGDSTANMTLSIRTVGTNGFVAVIYNNSGGTQSLTINWMAFAR